MGPASRAPVLLAVSRLYTNQHWIGVSLLHTRTIDRSETLLLTTTDVSAKETLLSIVDVSANETLLSMVDLSANETLLSMMALSRSETIGKVFIDRKTVGPVLGETCSLYDADAYDADKKFLRVRTEVSCLPDRILSVDKKMERIQKTVQSEMNRWFKRGNIGQVLIDREATGLTLRRPSTSRSMTAMSRS